MQTRRENWDIVKAFLIFLVVLGHILDGYIDKSNFLRAIHLFIYSFHMPLFLFVSGLLTSKLDFKKTIKKSGKMLLLYILAQLIFSINVYLVSGKYDFQLMQIGSWPWYIFSLAVFIFLTYLISNINKAIIITICLVISIIAGYFDVIYMKFSLSRIIVFYLFFYLGYIFSVHEFDKIIEKKNNIVLFSLILFVIFLFIYFNIEKMDFLIYIFKGMYPYSRLKVYTTNYKIIGPLLRLGFYITSILISSILLLAIPSKCNLVSVRHVGQSTLYIYLLHFTLIILFEKYILKGEIKYSNGLITCGLLTLQSIVICYILSINYIRNKKITK